MDMVILGYGECLVKMKRKVRISKLVARLIYDHDYPEYLISLYCPIKYSHYPLLKYFNREPYAIMLNDRGTYGLTSHEIKRRY